MTPILIELTVILMLVAVNGLFAMAELAVISARKARLRQWADAGDRRARDALVVADDPNRFLATVQVGITLVGTLAGVFGGATLAGSLATRMEDHPTFGPHCKSIGLGIVVASLTIVTLIFGELVPKRLAMHRPERVASLLAPPLRLLARLGLPIVRLLSGSSELILRGLGVRGEATSGRVIEEEVSVLVKEGALSGVFDPAEHEIVRRVFRLGDRRAYSLMTPRSEIVWLDLADPPEAIQQKIAGSPHVRFPVCEGTLDNIVGVVQVKDLLTRGFEGRAFQLKGALTLPLLIYEGTRGLKVLELFKNSGTHVALVLNEYGSVEGLLTLTDLLEAIVGDLPTGDALDEGRAVRLEDGAWRLVGKFLVDEFHDLFEGSRLPDGDYQTLAGFVMARLGRIPAASDRLDWAGFRFEVIEMDGNRVGHLLVTPPGADDRRNGADRVSATA